MTQSLEKVAVPEELKRLRREHEAAVNEVLVARERELLLVHWFDMAEHSDACQFGGGLKNKYPYEAECVAVGISTGHPATSYYRNVRSQHYMWALPVQTMWKLVLESEMKATSEQPNGQISGAFPELPSLWDHQLNQHGKAEFANFPWEKSSACPSNMGGSHLSLEVAEPLNYQPFGDSDDRMRCERAAQVVIGYDEVMAWLQDHLRNYLTNKQVQDRLIPDIHRLTGYNWTRRQAA